MLQLNLTEEELKELLLNSFYQGEAYEKEWYLHQIGELEEINEKDFNEWYKDLDLIEFENKD